MMTYFIPLIASYAPMWDYVLYFLLALFVVATSPCIIRQIVRLK